MASTKAQGKVVDLMVALRQSLAGVPVTGDPDAKPFLDYDEKYDMAASTLAAPCDVDAAISMSFNDMREAGVEPAFLSEPDPKSHQGPESADSRALVAGESATERHPATAGSAESTTRSTTRSAVRREYSPL